MDGVAKSDRLISSFLGNRRWHWLPCSAETEGCCFCGQGTLDKWCTSGTYCTPCVWLLCSGRIIHSLLLSMCVFLFFHLGLLWSIKFIETFPSVINFLNWKKITLENVLTKFLRKSILFQFLQSLFKFVLKGSLTQYLSKNTEFQKESN